MKTTFKLICFLSGPPLGAGQQWEVGGGLALWRREHQAGGAASPEEQQPGEIPAQHWPHHCPVHQQTEVRTTQSRLSGLSTEEI